jgi:rRNA maturation RNase YbeY
MNDYAITIVLSGNKLVRALNKKYLRHDYNTDVLAFSFGTGTTIDGEVYINVERARIQAKEFGASFGEEVARLVIHGTLHLVGYDDTTKREQEQMRTREDLYLAMLMKGKKR